MGVVTASVLAVCICGGGETVLLDFYGDHCPPCKAMQPVIRQLEARGYPVRKVNVQRDPALAAQFGVRAIPCFVMIVDGQEVDRVVGATTASRLEQMFGKASAVRPGGPFSPKEVPVDATGSSSLPIPAVRSDAAFTATPSEGFQSRQPLVPAPRVPGSEPDTGTPHPVQARSSPPSGRGPASASEEALGELEAHLIASTVRLRIEDASGHSCGSGTIIDSRNGEALILTCGHLFRDSQGKGRIEVDLFGPTPAERIPGRLVHYDLEKDLGLLSIRVPGPVRVARVAPPGYQVAKGSRVVSVGCNNGSPPSARQAHVTAIDKFLGPANIVASGLPVQGRSGGGLFSQDGLLIGVCNAAVPTDNEGLYAALAAIHSVLEQSELAFVCRSNAINSNAPSIGNAVKPPQMPKQMPPPSDLVRLTEGPWEPAEKGVNNSQGAPGGKQTKGPPEQSAQLRPEEQAALEEIHRKAAEGAEVICVIRSRGNPQARSEIIVVDKASAAFLQQLTSERQAGQGLETAESDWRPRWLQPGYQGE